jgi:hypothetical protein
MCTEASTVGSVPPTGVFKVTVPFWDVKFLKVSVAGAVVTVTITLPFNWGVLAVPYIEPGTKILFRNKANCLPVPGTVVTPKSTE